MNERAGGIGVYKSGVPWRVLSVWWSAVGSLVRMVPSDDEHMAQTTQMVRDTFLKKSILS